MAGIRFLAVVAAAATLSLSAAPVLADDWALPQTATYLSANQQMRLTVTPRDPVGPLSEVEGQIAVAEVRGAPLQTARARLERKGPNGGWTRIWQKPLANRIAPVRAIVADGGRYVVTFDNWHSIGLGENVVVIYGPGGELVRSLRLADLLPESWIRALPRSVSSLHWGGRHHFSSDGTRLVLKVALPPRRSSADPPEYADLEVDLATGRPLRRAASRP